MSQLSLSNGSASAYSPAPAYGENVWSSFEVHLLERELRLIDLHQVLRRHAEDLKAAEKRLGIQVGDFSAVRSLLRRLAEALQPNPQGLDLRTDLESLLDCVTECFRVVRNACVASEANQDAALHCHLHESTVNILHQVLSVRDITVPACSRSRDDSGSLAAVRVGIQMLGNIVTQNKTCQKAVWTSCFPRLFGSVLSCGDVKAMEYLCMLVFNCLDVERGTQLAICSDSSDIVEGIIKLSTLDGAEWSMLVLERLISLGHFPLLIDATTDPDARLLLIDILAGLASGTSHSKATESQTSGLPAATKDTISCVCSLFESTSESVRSTYMRSPLLGGLVNTLSCLTAQEHLLALLQARQAVLTRAVLILVSLVQTDVTIQEQPTPSRQSLPVDHGWSLKRDLVRLIGNLCYQNNTNQQLVRETGGIPAILSVCSIDDSNPFIREWAVFAIRNLCDGNVENQASISQLEQRGMADSPVCRQLGVEVCIGPGGKPVIRKLPTQEEDK